MTDKTKGDFAHIGDDLRKWAADVQRQHLQAQSAEAARRAKLSPQERAAEDAAKQQQIDQAERQALRKKLLAMGDAVLKRETWTIEKFCWLLAANNPEVDDSWTLFGERTGRVVDNHQLFIKILVSCIGTRLVPVNPQDDAKAHRYLVGRLIEVSRAKELGCAEVLAELIEKRGDDTPIVATIEEHTTQPRATTTEWQDTLAALCAEIEQAVADGKLPPFQKTEVPWSPKTLYHVLTLRYAAAGLGDLPVNADTMRKHLNKVHGWKSKAGYQDPTATAQLRAVLGL